MKPIEVLASVTDFLSRPARLFIGGAWQEAASGRCFVVEIRPRNHRLPIVRTGRRSGCRCRGGSPTAHREAETAKAHRG